MGEFYEQKMCGFISVKKFKVHLTVAKQRIFDNYKSLLADIYLF